MLKFRLCEGLLEKVRANFELLCEIDDATGLLDVLCSAAHYHRTKACVFPEFGKELVLKNARHPLIPASECVPNDMFSGPDHEFTLISGGNMSGKSTYLKTIALLQIIAQIGYPVTAEFASLPVRDAIYTRFGSDDDLESNYSSFFRELKDVNDSLQHATSSSLILIDELGRGTSISDGLAISTAIFEEFLKRKAFIFAVTHFERLINYMATIPSVNILCMSANEGKLPKFRAHPGRLDEDGYGIALAERCGFPPDIIVAARNIKSHVQLIFE